MVDLLAAIEKKYEDAAFRREIFDNSGDGRSGRYHSANTDPEPQPNNPFLSGHSRVVRHTEASQQRQNGRDTHQPSAEGINGQSLPIRMNSPFQFPTEQRRVALREQ